MRIGIADDMFYSLQGKLLDEGHDVFVLVEGCPKLPAKSFNRSTSTHHEKLHQVGSMAELLSANCDLVLVGTENFDLGYEKAVALSRNTKTVVSGHDAVALSLERDRDFCKVMCRRFGLDTYFKIPDSKVFTSQDDLVAFLRKTRKKWVIKPSSLSPRSADMFRTVVIDNNKAFADSIPEKNSWFIGGEGGCILEEYADGLEVSFGYWNDNTPVETSAFPYYFYIEHKGACNGDRGNILTGEVGTTMRYSYREGTRVHAMLTAVRTMMHSLSNSNGMVDLNFKMNTKTGELTLLEFTCRFGRPTLEMMIALSPNIGSTLYDLATSGYTDSFSTEHAVGVSVFTYGLPLVTHLSTLDPGSFVKSNSFIQPRDFSLPKETQGNVILQLFATADHSRGTMVTAFEDRQFISIGLHNSPGCAIDNAYRPLRTFNALGLTWRDDIGHSLEATEGKLLEFGWL